MFEPKLTDVNLQIENNENEECKKCKGRCCKSMGCEIFPTDLQSYPNITREDVIELLQTGYVSIDWWNDLEQFKKEYYLRMRNKGGDLADPSFGGECIALTENGCRFEFKNRPLGGRDLHPTGQYDELGKSLCSREYDKFRCKEEWKPYNDILEKIKNEIYSGELHIVYNRCIDDIPLVEKRQTCYDKDIFDDYIDILLGLNKIKNNNLVIKPK